MKDFINWIAGGGLLGLFTLLWRSNYIHEQRAKEISENMDKKIRRAYDRFDEHKKNTEEKFVENKVCEVVRQQFIQQFSDINGLLIQMNAKLDRFIENGISK